MPKRQSSAELSSLASKIAQLKHRPGLSGATVEHDKRYVPVESYNELVDNAKKLAGSVLSQDETRGG